MDYIREKVFIWIYLHLGSTVFTLSIRIPYLTKILVQKFEIIHSATNDVLKYCCMYGSADPNQSAVWSVFVVRMMELTSLTTQNAHSENSNQTRNMQTDLNLCWGTCPKVLFLTLGFILFNTEEKYHVYPKYWDILTSSLTCPKILRNLFNYLLTWL